MREILKQIAWRIKYVKIKNILSIFPMLIGLSASIFFRIYHKNIWLICERRDEARDNGYWFFKYMVAYHPEIESVYVINKKSSDYKKVKSLGKVISFGSINHWKYYFSARKNISSQKEGKPDAALCYIIEVCLGLIRNRVFIQHGITQNDVRWLYYDVSKINLFTCAVQREYNYIFSNFGYPKDAIKLTGFCRYDNLLVNHNKFIKQIVLMPTQRSWLCDITSDTLKYEESKNFEKSEYYKVFQSLLNNSKLCDLLNEHDVSLVFYPHARMQQYLKLFNSMCEKIVIADISNYDVQELLLQSSLLITDYSSVHFDFAYMNKPIIYYQFDYDKFRKGQYKEGYFSYENDGFGPVVYNEDNLVLHIKKILEDKFAVSDIYQDRIESFFTFHDTKNCARTYDAIVDMEKENEAHN